MNFNRKVLHRIRKSNPLRSVGSKLFIIFFISIAAFVLVVGMTSYSISKNVIASNASESSVEVLEMAQINLEYFYQSFEKVSKQIVTNSEISKYLTEIDNIEDKASFDHFSKVSKLSEKVMPIGLSNSSIKGISIMNPKGELLTVFGSASQIKDTGWTKNLDPLQTESVWLQGGPDSFTNSADVIAIARRFVDAYTLVDHGIVVIEIPVKELAKEMSKVTLGNGNQVMIVDSHNTIVQASESLEPGMPSPIQLSTEQQAMDKDSFLLDDHLIAFSKSSNSGWYLVGTIPTDSLIQGARQILTNTIYMCIGAAILAILIGFLMIRLIARPLVKLMGFMGEGANGNLNIRSNYKSKDEIGRLGRSFDRMMEEITNLVQHTNHSAHEVLKTAETLTNASRTTALASREIAVATEQISGGAAGLATESEKGSELTQQIADKMRNVIESNTSMSEAAHEVRLSSEQGIQNMQHLNTKTEAADEMIRSMVSKVDHLNKSTQSIVKILDMLHSMTKQTNILSLNASIEAARAGSAGRGFKVVADQIYQLAAESRESIDIVGQITESIQNGIQDTVQVLASAYPIFQEQIDAVKETSAILQKVQGNMGNFIGQLSSASESVADLNQSQSVLSAAMMNVSAVAEEALATSEEVASLSSEQLTVSDNLVQLSEQLEQLSDSLHQSLSRFRV
ncbi:methyl-accepting chemotaxis protein [Paenibacillus albiflavus]|uniref:Methyl-accepting chemotaxis protein n=1 Tax=Paenibacillus albiflavus TaxID=2545760 RepID=A0A4R4EBE4_9BACL|nr:methyl-accepting chemotaxis protein [Paenibacillus albiflavus]TCZ77204.1 methyl-accepting chemotaxis protein [Paenibacillus albiflavus]